MTQPVTPITSRASCDAKKTVLIIFGAKNHNDCHLHHNQPAVPHVLESLGGAVVFLDHEVGGGDCGAAAVAHVAAG